MPYRSHNVKERRNLILDPHMEWDQHQNLTSSMWSSLAHARLPSLVNTHECVCELSYLANRRTNRQMYGHNKRSIRLNAEARRQ